MMLPHRINIFQIKLELVSCKLSHLKSFTVCIPLFWLTISGLLPLWGTKFDQRIGLWWERIFLVNWGLNVCWFGRDAHSLYVTSSSTIKCLNMTDDYSHASVFLCIVTIQEQRPFPNFQIVYLCACLLWRPSVYIYEYIYIYIYFSIYHFCSTPKLLILHIFPALYSYKTIHSFLFEDGFQF